MCFFLSYLPLISHVSDFVEVSFCEFPNERIDAVSPTEFTDTSRSVEQQHNISTDWADYRIIEKILHTAKLILSQTKSKNWNLWCVKSVKLFCVTWRFADILFKHAETSFQLISIKWDNEVWSCSKWIDFTISYACFNNHHNDPEILHTTTLILT